MALGTSTPPRSYAQPVLIIADYLQDRRPIVISGPSGVGKGTLCQMLLDAHPKTFATTVSHTTRKPRPGEIEDVTYFYVTSTQFSSLISQNAFVEHTFFGGNYYGTSKQTIIDQMAKGLVVVLDIEIDGVKQMKSLSTIDARYVFIKPPSFETLEERLRNRGTESEKSIEDRLARARVELEYAETKGAFDVIIVNDDLKSAYEELSEFIYKSAL
jgi:guanylate kinase